MSVTIKKLEGAEVPDKYRATHEVVWAVLVNDGVIEYCVTEDEAIALQKKLKRLEQQKKNARDSGLSR